MWRTISLLLLLTVTHKNIYCQPPNFSDLDYKAKSPELPHIPSAALSICSIYDSKQSLNFDVQQRCEIAANSKSPSGLAGCQILPDVVNLLKSCSDKNAFEREFIKIAKSKIDSFSSPDGWGIWGIGVAFEPFTFEDTDYYAPYQNNGLVSNTDEFQDLVNIYNYYTECLSVAGKDCMWYHISKTQAYYKQQGGVWLLELETIVDGLQQKLASFFVPVVIQGRFYGIIITDVAYK
eukprot:TRINITY_DN23256_c0_g1_i1.p1 TRINITY_DN23256_c0_g1~~TRINITY_DN23256_c0_g1_i1.p1  ORF type:complete len:246 (+),score=13.72 TRINITY_DN23256_c0_g1_i1:35-739(+)